MYSFITKNAAFRTIVLITLCFTVVLLGLHYSKKLCIKDRSYLCGAYSFTLTSDESTVLKPHSMRSAAPVMPLLLRAEDLAVSIFHPPRVS